MRIAGDLQRTPLVLTCWQRAATAAAAVRVGCAAAGFSFLVSNFSLKGGSEAEGIPLVFEAGPSDFDGPKGSFELRVSGFESDTNGSGTDLAGPLELPLAGGCWALLLLGWDLAWL